MRTKALPAKTLITAIALGLQIVEAQNTSLTTQWVRRYSLDERFDCRSVSIKNTTNGDVVVGGWSDDRLGTTEYVAVKYSGEGGQLWASRYSNGFGTTNRLSGAVIDESGNTLLTGTSDTVKLGLDGRKIWSAPLSGTGIDSNPAYAYIIGLTNSRAISIQLGNATPSPEDVILDVDPGQDWDDLSDSAIANNLMSRGEINILAMMGAHRAPHIAEMIQIMNRFYGHPQIPVAVATNGPVLWDGYGWIMVNKYGETLGYDLPVPESSHEYRKILSSRPDHSITIIFMGQLRNLLTLWDTTGDDYSPLSGAELLEKKAKQLMIIAGYFPTSGTVSEYNFATDLEASQVLNRITNSVPVTYMGIEQGDTVIIPAMGIDQLDVNNPVRYIFDLASITNRSSWSGLALLMAARGKSWRGNDYYETVQGHITVETNGVDHFTPDAFGNQAYARKMQNDGRFIEMLDDLLLREAPGRTWTTNRNGRALWLKDFVHPGFTNAASQIVKLDSFGDAVIGGVAATEDGSGGCFVLQKIGEAGRVRWTTHSGGDQFPPLSQVVMRDLATVGNSIWAFGQYGATAAVFKFNPDGAPLWSYKIPGENAAARMIVDPNGFANLVHLAGNTVSVTHLTPEGAIDRTFSHSFSERLIGIDAIAIDSQQNLYLAGNAEDETGGSKLILITLDGGFVNLGLSTFPSQYAGEARASAISLDGSGNVYLTGYLPSARGGTEIITIKSASPLTPELLSNGGLRLKFYATASSDVALESTEDFVSWQSISTNRANTNGIVQFESGLTSGDRLKFYRTRQLNGN